MLFCHPAQEWNQMPVAQSVATNNQLAIVANRFNYVFNLKGTSNDSVVSFRIFGTAPRACGEPSTSGPFLVLCSHVG